MKEEWGHRPGSAVSTPFPHRPFSAQVPKAASMESKGVPSRWPGVVFRKCVCQSLGLRPYVDAVGAEHPRGVPVAVGLGGIRKASKWSQRPQGV